MEEHTKKLLLYGGGAASILGLILYVKNKQAAAAANVGYAPSGTGTAGTSSDPSIAAAINAATQQQIAQLNQQTALAQIAAQQGIATAQIQGAVQVAGIQASGQKTAAVISAVGGAAGVTAITKFFDFVKTLLGGGSGAGAGSDSGAPGTSGSSSQSWVDAMNATKNNTIASQLNQIGIGPGDYGSVSLASWIDPKIYQSGEVFQGNTGSGDSTWFGSAPSDPVTPAGQPFTGPPEYAGQTGPASGNILDADNPAA